MTSSLLKTSLSQLRSRVSQLFGKPPQLASLGRVTSYPVREEPDYHRAGGFHPIRLGDTFHHGQYTILRKLGYGQYSTVWLAKDAKHQRFVAIKVQRADCYGGRRDIFEREILSKISEVSKRSSHQGRNHVLHHLEKSTHTGPNGDHVCFAFDVLGHHLGFQTIKYEDGKLPVQAVKVIARQLLLGLDFLHRECGIVHTDVKPTNILLELEDQDTTISSYLSKVPARTDPQCVDGGVAHPFERLIDFGVSSWRERHLAELIQSPALRAPEVTIGAPWDTGVDICSLGCLIIELVQGIVLFSGEGSLEGTWTAEDDHLAEIVEIIGPFPLEFIEKGNRAAHFFDKKGNLRRTPNLGPTCLERLVDGQEKPFLKPIDMPKTEVPIVIDFVKGMLQIDPRSRKSAAELLKHQWIQAKDEGQISQP